MDLGGGAQQRLQMEKPTKEQGWSVSMLRRRATLVG
jgi:hypothetical protein